MTLLENILAWYEAIGKLPAKDFDCKSKFNLLKQDEITNIKSG